MTMYVLERRVPRSGETHTRHFWQQYAVCGRRSPLERVRLGLGGTKEWRIRKTAAAGRPFSRAA